MKGSTVEIKICFKNPKQNYYGNKVSLDHIDLIAGDITGIVLPESQNYNNPINPSTIILKRFSACEWKKNNEGFNCVTYSYKAIKSQYFRLRGTNIPVNTKNETDENGNPLCDTLTGSNNEKEAWNDLWFYSNPIFVEVTN